MALPGSGTITLGMIAAEFGGSTPHSLNEYYRGGGLVPNSPANAGIPTSGAISLSHFYGASAFTHAATLPGSTGPYFGQNIEVLTHTFDPYEETSAGIYFGSGGWLTGGSGGSVVAQFPSDSGTWLAGDGTDSDYDVMFEVTGGWLYSGNGDTWINMASTPTFLVVNTGSSYGQATGVIHIRPAGGGSDLATCSIILYSFMDA